MCNVQVLLTQGVDQLASIDLVAEESLTLEYVPVVQVPVLIISWLMHIPHRIRRGCQIFDNLHWIIPCFSDRLLESEEWQVIEMAKLVCFVNSKLISHSSKIQKGISSARSDDTKGLK